MLLTIRKYVSSYNHGAFAGYTSYYRELNGWVSFKIENEIVMYHLLSYELLFPNYFLPSCLMLLLLPTFYLFCIVKSSFIYVLTGECTFCLAHYQFDLERKRKLVLVYGVLTSKLPFAYFSQKIFVFKGKVNSK